MTFRLTQISDTHLSREKPFFAPNFKHVAAHLAAAKPDLIVNTGDLALDAIERRDDLAFARELHDAIGLPWRAIPGNHDVGDNPNAAAVIDQPVSEENRAAFRATIGEDWWSFDREGWCFIGLNNLLFASDLPSEADQWTFIEAVLAGALNRPIALFVHKPLFHERPDETHADASVFTPSAARHRLLALLARVRVRLIASGHVHQHREARHGGATHVWAPSSAFIMSDADQPRLGDKLVGLVDYVFEGERVTITRREIAGMIAHDLNDVPGAYALSMADYRRKRDGG
jgi:3',5'-cyclic AMP phosphodiesterase CpdA